MDILSPVSFRNDVRAKNRVALAPMTNLQSHADGTLSDDELNWLSRRAEGGFGIVMTCAAHVGKDGRRASVECERGRRRAARCDGRRHRAGGSAIR